MGIFGKIIGLAIAETANTAVRPGVENRNKDRKAKRDK